MLGRRCRLMPIGISFCDEPAIDGVAVIGHRRTGLGFGHDWSFESISS